MLAKTYYSHYLYELTDNLPNLCGNAIPLWGLFEL
jgi:hypothetical protein